MCKHTTYTCSYSSAIRGGPRVQESITTMLPTSLSFVVCSSKIDLDSHSLQAFSRSFSQELITKKNFDLKIFLQDELSYENFSTRKFLTQKFNYTNISRFTVYTIYSNIAPTVCINQNRCVLFGNKTLNPNTWEKSKVVYL